MTITKMVILEQHIIITVLTNYLQYEKQIKLKMKCEVMGKHLRLFRVIYVTILISILASLLAVLWLNLFLPPRTIVIQANPVRGEQGLPGRDGDRGPAGKDARTEWPDGSRSSIPLWTCPSGVLMDYDVYMEKGWCPTK